MISVVLYGRNDSYGYNLHKRAALSFNCIAELLEDEADEILFVDYNTPNDFPTFPEAIQDTLTDKAKRRLRILRVRPHVHDRFSTKTHLIALEPIARNIAVRRSNSANRWVLSTNTDMIFVPQSGLSLTAVARDLPPGFYHAPRIEIPETLWESLDRTKSIEAIETVREWGTTLHLNEIVKGSPTILYDGPGDFQLMERDVVSNMQGFHEEMILGWHVDSNIAKRLLLHYGSIGDLGNDVYGYHCDHTRQITPAHSSNRANDWWHFVDDVTRSDIPEQRDTWGCPDEEIEEIRLGRDNSTTYVSALRAAIGEPLTEPYQSLCTGAEYGKSKQDPRHVLPFLSDLFVCAPRNTNVGWIGRPNEMLGMFAEVWHRLGFTGRVLVDGSLAQEPTVNSIIESADTSAILARADAFVFDFPTPDSRDEVVDGDQTIRLLRGFLLEIVRAEHKRLRGGIPLRQVIAINAINNDWEGFFVAFVAAGVTPFGSHMRHGYVLPQGPQDWTNSLHAGDAGLKDRQSIRARDSAVGLVAWGLHKWLIKGRYKLVFSLSGATPLSSAKPGDIVGGVTFLSWRIFVAWKAITWADMERGELEVEINVADDVSVQDMVRLEAFVYNWYPVDLRIDRVTCESIGPPQDAPSLTECRALMLDNWLPMLTLGPNGRRQGLSVVSVRSGNLFHGPFWYLPAGAYSAVFDIECNSRSDDALIGKIDAVQGLFHTVQSLNVLKEFDFSAAALKAGGITLPFSVGEIPADRGFVEIRLWSTGVASFTVRSIHVRARQAGDVDPVSPARARKTAMQIVRRLASRVRAATLRNTRKQVLT